MRKIGVFPSAIGLDARTFFQFVFVLTILLFASVVFADDLSTLEEGFVCENIRVQVSTTCASDPEAPFDETCRTALYFRGRKRKDTCQSAGIRTTEREGGTSR